MLAILMTFLVIVLCFKFVQKIAGSMGDYGTKAIQAVVPLK